MGWLTGRPEEKQVRGQAFQSLFGAGAMDALYPEPSFVNFANVGFSKNELVYACIMEKATSLPEAPLRVFGPDGLGEPREGHPLRQLIANPNPVMTEFEMFELLSIHLDLAGTGFWELVRDRGGQPRELWPLRPDLVRIKPSPDGRHRFGYVLGGGKVVDLGTDVVQFKLPNPVDPYVGQPPMRPALRAVALDNEATDFVKALLQNRAVPGVVVTMQNASDEAITKRLTAKWKEKFGGNRRGEPAFLERGMDAKVLGLNLDELEFPDLRSIAESRICSAFGVPPILVGAKVGLDRSTFANYGEARRSFWEETLMPLQTRIASVVVKRLLPEFQGVRPRRTVVKFDNSNVVALRESERARWELATQALRAGGITVADFRRYVGLPPIPGADVFLRPAGVVPTDASGKPLFDETEPDAAPATQSTDEDDAMDEDQKLFSRTRALSPEIERAVERRLKLVAGGER